MCGITFVQTKATFTHNHPIDVKPADVWCTVFGLHFAMQDCSGNFVLRLWRTGPFQYFPFGRLSRRTGGLMLPVDIRQTAFGLQITSQSCKKMPPLGTFRRNCRSDEKLAHTKKLLLAIRLIQGIDKEIMKRKLLKKRLPAKWTNFRGGEMEPEDAMYTAFMPVCLNCAVYSWKPVSWCRGMCQVSSTFSVPYPLPVPPTF